MPGCIPTRVWGRDYPSQRAAAAENDVSPNYIFRAVEAGETEERPKSKPRGRRGIPTPIRGTVYPSRAAAARGEGVNVATIHEAAARNTLDNVGTRKHGGRADG